MTNFNKVIDRTSYRPIWQQIRDILLSEIRAGELGADGRLPAAGRLADRFGVNRHTVRQSLMALEDAGVTETRQGAGSFIVAPVVDYPISARTRFSDIVLSQGKAPSGEILRIGEKASTREIAEALELKHGRPVLMVENSCRADGRMIGLARHFFPAERFRPLRQAFKETTSISQALRSVGVENYSRRSTTVSSRLPTSREARLLQQPLTRPVLVSKAVNVDDDGQPIEFGVTLFLADRVRLRFDN